MQRIYFIVPFAKQEIQKYFDQYSTEQMYLASSI